MTTYYKVLVDGKSCHGGDMQWSLPVQGDDGTWTPGEVMSVEGRLSLCQRGLHLTTEPDKWWRLGCRYYEAEVTGSKGKAEGDKCVLSACRLLRQMPVPDYLRHCEALIDEVKGITWFSQRGPIDPAWKLFTAPTLDAARDAARHAAWDGARVAAWDGARVAAWDAAWVAAWAAAWDAAWAAARVAARDAARVAARDAARDAARHAAWDGARVAAWDAAWVAAWDGARDAAWAAQIYVLVQGICADLPLEQCHRDHIEARMEVWRRGYGLYCDINGVLYVYGVKQG